MNKERAEMLAAVANAKKHDATTYHLQVWLDEHQLWLQDEDRFYLKDEAVTYLEYHQDFCSKPMRLVMATPFLMGNHWRWQHD